MPSPPRLGKFWLCMSSEVGYRIKSSGRRGQFYLTKPSAFSVSCTAGRNVAVVRTEVFAASGKRVLETVSNHAIAARP